MTGFDYIIAVDAMGGDNSPNKIVEGISLFLKEDKNIFFNIYGKEDLIKKSLEKFSNISSDNCKIFNCETKIEDKNSVRDAIKVGKDSSMWRAIDSVKNKESHLIISSGNTGALLVISKLLIKMMDDIDKPAIAGLWPNLKGTSIVLDLGANIEFNEKNYIEFSKILHFLSLQYQSLWPLHLTGRMAHFNLQRFALGFQHLILIMLLE